MKAAIRKATASASRSRGRCYEKAQPGWWCTPPAGRGQRYLRRLVPVPWKKARSRSVSLGLDHKNPWLSPFEEFQRFKTHLAIRSTWRAASASATVRARSRPAVCRRCPRPYSRRRSDRLRSFLNASRIKGSHAAKDRHAGRRSRSKPSPAAPTMNFRLPAAFERSWLHEELSASKNFKQWFKKGLWIATFMNGIEQWLLPGLGIRTPPWTIRRRTRPRLPGAGRETREDRHPSPMAC